MKEHGYGTMPRVEDTLACYLSSESASSLKALTLPTNPVVLNLFFGGQGLHYSGSGDQADLLKDLDKGEGERSDVIKELLSGPLRRRPVPSATPCQLWWL